MKYIISYFKAIMTNFNIFWPIANAMIYSRGLFMHLTYIAGINRKSRNEKLIIRERKKCLTGKSLTQMAASLTEPIDDFINANGLSYIKTAEIVNTITNDNSPILLCAVKNDLQKVVAQVKYHRTIGVKHFAYIDNMSTDGTRQWLYNQKDVTLFEIDERFLDIRKNAWRNQAINILGKNRRYLVVDSDEFFIYPGAETKTINDYYDFVIENGVESALVPMIDMYCNGKLFNFESENFIKDYCYFDTKTYHIYNGFFSRFVYGGPRTRVLRYSAQLAKYPVIQMNPTRLTGTHFNYPYNINHKTKYAIAFLLHYKTFSPSDIIKFNNYIETGIHADDSADYRKYMQVYKNNPDLTYYYKYSQKLNDSMDLLKINIIDKKFYAKFLRK